MGCRLNGRQKAWSLGKRSALIHALWLLALFAIPPASVLGSEAGGWAVVEYKDAYSGAVTYRAAVHTAEGQEFAVACTGHEVTAFVRSGPSDLGAGTQREVRFQFDGGPIYRSRWTNLKDGGAFIDGYEALVMARQAAVSSRLIVNNGARTTLFSLTGAAQALDAVAAGCPTLDLGR